MDGWLPIPFFILASTFKILEKPLPVALTLVETCVITDKVRAVDISHSQSLPHAKTEKGYLGVFTLKMGILSVLAQAVGVPVGRRSRG